MVRSAGRLRCQRPRHRGGHRSYSGGVRLIPAAICQDVASEPPLRALGALLDRNPSQYVQGVVPHLAHWLYFQPIARQSDIGADGHPRREDGEADALPRRMWAGGRVDFVAPIRIGSALVRETRSIKRERKQGKSGVLLFETLEHLISADGRIAIREEQDLVYRAIATEKTPPSEAQVANALPTGRVIKPDETMLFRYSALTFNAHRIHYDLPYAQAVEGYPSLVVQAPLIATLLLDVWLERSAEQPGHFSFRAERPAFCNDLLSLHIDDGLRAAKPDGSTAMHAEVR